VKLLFIVNTSASSVTERARVVIQKALSADHDVTTALTSRRGHATRLAQGAASQRLDAVVVLGGDGTLNEAANGLAGSSTALGILPGGSTNVYARTLGLADDPVEATGELLGAMARNSTRRVGLGSVNDRYFLFHVGVGFDAAVVEQVEKRAALKRYASHPLFVYAAFLTWFRHFDRSRPRFAVQFPAGAGSPEAVVDDGYFAICLKTNPYTYLGTTPLNVAPGDATLDSPLVLVTFRSVSMMTLLGAAGAALRSRSLRKRRRLDYRTGLPGFTLTGHGPVPYQVDGDFLGETDRLVFKHEPDCLTIFTP
jgi:diacylglycerol kinase family enzyme